ncbi:MAG: hypothetical protein WCK59_03320 [Candidatus Falkowbacteria bacterium]
MTFINETNYTILKIGIWFMVVADIQDTEVKTKNFDDFVRKISEKNEIMEAYHDGSLEFDESVSTELQEEIKTALDNVMFDESIMSDISENAD